MVYVRLLIGNGDVEASSGAIFDRKNPISGKVVSRAAAATAADARAAVEAAAGAFPGWSQIGPSERRNRLLRAAELL